MQQDIRIVLVEPSHPGNIGGACRAMKTMGLTDLVVVNPERFPDPQAQWRAAGAQDVLNSLTLCDTVAEAIADCHYVVGTSTRARRIPVPLGTVEEVAGDVLGQPAGTKSAILFGRETNGLHNEELQLCHKHLQIPANPDYPSLNLAMAVQIVCYELNKQLATQPQLDARWDRPPATASQLDGMLAQMESLMLQGDCLDPQNPGQAMTRLRRLFTRIRADETEVQMLRGVFKQLQSRLKP